MVIDYYAQVKALLENVKPFSNLDPIFLTDRIVIKATHTRLILNLSDITKSCKTAQICPSNNNISLISLRKLCYNGYEAKINNKVCKLYKENKTILIAIYKTL